MAFSGEKAGRLLNFPEGTGKNDPAQSIDGAKVEKPQLDPEGKGHVPCRGFPAWSGRA